MFKTGDFPVRYVTVYQAGYLMSTERACSIPRRATVHCWSVREVWRHMPVGDACRSHGIWFFFLGKMSPMIRCFFEILVLMELGSSVIFYGYSMDILWIFYGYSMYILSSTPTGWWFQSLWKICEFISWDDFPFPTEWKVRIHSMVPVTTNQPKKPEQYSEEAHSVAFLHGVPLRLSATRREGTDTGARALAGESLVIDG